MRYEKQILQAFERVGFKPRGDQVADIDQILVAFLDEGVKNVILSAPTGTGKSIIGAVVAEAIHSIRCPDLNAGASFLLTATNALAEQYHDTFVDDDAPADDNFYMIKGATNYECAALSTPEEVQTADVCSLRVFRKNGMDDVIDRYCNSNSCEYLLSRSMKARARHLITNYAYYFLDRLFSSAPMEKRSVCVFDEAHLLNDLFTEQKSIFFSEQRLVKCAEEIADNLALGNTDVFKELKLLREHLAAGKINDSNYNVYLRTLLRVYTATWEAAQREAQRNTRAQSTYIRLSKLAKKYHNLSCAIDDLFLFEYPHVFEYKKKDPKKGQGDHEVSVKPIFIGDMFEALDNADFNLLMSATISEQFVRRTMTLPGTTKLIRLAPKFNPANKKVIFFKPQTLNYETMKQEETIKRLCATAYQIVEHHSNKGERGIILTPSFAVAASISESLRRVSDGRYRVFEHARGEKLAERLDDFRQFSAGPAVLITPSGFEGVDLPGDLSRYQVIVKMPFGSLGDKRIKTILDNFPDIYGTTALMKVVQGAGRSVRSPEDYATTYMLDTAAQRSWTSSSNAWKDEFETSFKSTLSSD